MITLRRARDEDAAAVGALIARFFAEEGFPGDAASIAGAAGRFRTEPANAVFLATDGVIEVGVATVTTTFGFEEGRYAEMEDLYVVPSHRERGIASDLIEAVAAWARSAGCAALEVVTTPEGDAKHGLGTWYGRRGFSDEGRRILRRRLSRG